MRYLLIVGSVLAAACATTPQQLCGPAGGWRTLQEPPPYADEMLKLGPAGAQFTDQHSWFENETGHVLLCQQRSATTCHAECVEFDVPGPTPHVADNGIVEIISVD